MVHGLDKSVELPFFYGRTTFLISFLGEERVNLTWYDPMKVLFGKDWSLLGEEFKRCKKVEKISLTMSKLLCKRQNAECFTTVIVLKSSSSPRDSFCCLLDILVCPSTLALVCGRIFHMVFLSFNVAALRKQTLLLFWLIFPEIWHDLKTNILAIPRTVRTCVLFGN